MLNIGGVALVTVNGIRFELNKLDALYIGRYTARTWKCLEHDASPYAHETIGS